MFGAARVAPEKAVFRPALPMSCLPGISEMQMVTMTYREQYLSPHWQRKRLEVMEEAGYTCENCGDKETTLNVHHKRYVKGRKVWDYARVDLQCLCEPCHLEHHDRRALLDALIFGSDVSLDAVIGLVGGYLEGSLQLDYDVATEARRVGGGHFSLGLLASMVSEMPDALLRAADAGGSSPLTPPQETALQEWREFAANLGASGL